MVVDDVVAPGIGADRVAVDPAKRRDPPADADALPRLRALDTVVGEDADVLDLGEGEQAREQAVRLNSVP